MWRRKRVSEYWRLPVSSTISQAFTPAARQPQPHHRTGGAGDHQPRLCGLSHELKCREAGVQLLISCTDENPGQESVVVNNMISPVDGLIVASCMHNDADYLKLSQQPPVVLLTVNQ